MSEIISLAQDCLSKCSSQEETEEESGGCERENDLRTKISEIIAQQSNHSVSFNQGSVCCPN